MSSARAGADRLAQLARCRSKWVDHRGRARESGADESLSETLGESPRDRGSDLRRRDPDGVYGPIRRAGLSRERIRVLGRA